MPPKAGRRAGRVDAIPIDPLAPPPAPPVNEEGDGDKEGDTIQPAVDTSSSTVQHQPLTGLPPMTTPKPSSGPIPSFLDDDAPLPDFDEGSRSQTPSLQIGSQSPFVGSPMIPQGGTTPQQSAVIETTATTTATIERRDPTPSGATDSVIRNQSTMIFQDQPTVSARATGAPVSSAPKAESAFTSSSSTTPARAPITPAAPVTSAALEAELRALEIESTEREARVDQILQSSSSVVTDVEVTALREKEAEVAKLRRQIVDDEAKAATAIGVFADRKREEEAHLRNTTGKEAKQERQQELQAVTDEIKALKCEVEVLQSAHDQMTSDMVQQSRETSAVEQLGSMMDKLLANVRRSFDAKLRTLSQQEVENVMKKFVADRFEESQQRMLHRNAVLGDFRQQRGAAFDKFRQERRLAREETSDHQFATLKQRREKHTAEMKTKNARMIQEREASLDNDMKAARTAAQNTIDRLVARHSKAMEDTNRDLQRKETDALNRDEANRAHRHRLHEQERSSLETRLRHEETAQEDVLRRSGTKEEGKALAQRTATIDAMRAQLKDKLSVTLDAINSARTCASGSNRATFPASAAAASMLLERQAAVDKLRSVVLRRKDETSQLWSRLDKLVSRFDQQLQALTTNLSDGRSSIAVAQNRVDILRTSWEKDHRQRLAQSQLDDVLSRDETVVKVLADAAFGVKVLREKGSAMTRNRAQLLQRMDQAQDDVQLRQSELGELNNRLITRYDEVARMAASVEAKEIHLQREQQELAVAREALMDDLQRFDAAGEQLKGLSLRLHSEAEQVAVEHQENNHKLMYSQQWHQHHFQGGSNVHANMPLANSTRRNRHTSASRARKEYRGAEDPMMTGRSAVGFVDDFPSLIGLSSDDASRLRTTSSSSPSVRTVSGPGSSNPGTLTTPSPDTGDTGDDQAPNAPSSAGGVY